LIDPRSEAALRGQVRQGERLGAYGGRWRTLHAEVLTRLVQRGAKVVVFDFQFERFRDGLGQLRPATPLEQAGTEALASAILKARSAGTTVVIAAGAKQASGELDTHPSIRDALAQAPSQTMAASGSVASPCIAFAEHGLAVFLPLLIVHPQQPHQPSLALAALAGHWNLGNPVIDRAAGTLYLAEGGRQRAVQFAGMGRTVTGPEGCSTFVRGDVPAYQIVDVSRQELARANPAVIPFEHLLGTGAGARLDGKIVMVGADLRGSLDTRADAHRVLVCDATPWSCSMRERSGLDLHVDALNSLLTRRGTRPIGAWAQLPIMLLFTFAAAWLRLRNRDAPAWQRRGVLALLVMLDLALVSFAAIKLGVLMDEAYHLLAMVGAHLFVGRVDPPQAERSLRQNVV
jgi:CHASE2 domain-containing sensor protein